MAEWSNAHAWKACLPKGNQGSNPCPSVFLLLLLLILLMLVYSPFARRVITCKFCRTFTTLALGNTPRKFAPG